MVKNNKLPANLSVFCLSHFLYRKLPFSATWQGLPGVLRILLDSWNPKVPKWGEKNTSSYKPPADLSWKVSDDSHNPLYIQIIYIVWIVMRFECTEFLNSPKDTFRHYLDTHRYIQKLSRHQKTPSDTFQTPKDTIRWWYKDQHPNTVNLSSIYSCRSTQ